MLTELPGWYFFEQREVRCQVIDSFTLATFVLLKRTMLLDLALIEAWTVDSPDFKAAIFSTRGQVPTAVTELCHPDGVRMRVLNLLDCI